MRIDLQSVLLFAVNSHHSNSDCRRRSYTYHHWNIARNFYLSNDCRAQFRVSISICVYERNRILYHRFVTALIRLFLRMFFFEPTMRSVCSSCKSCTESSNKSSQTMWLQLFHETFEFSQYCQKSLRYYWKNSNKISSSFIHIKKSECFLFREFMIEVNLFFEISLLRRECEVIVWNSKLSHSIVIENSRCDRSVRMKRNRFFSSSYSLQMLRMLHSMFA